MDIEYLHTIAKIIQLFIGNVDYRRKCFVFYHDVVALLCESVPFKVLFNLKLVLLSHLPNLSFVIIESYIARAANYVIVLSGQNRFHRRLLLL